MSELDLRAFFAARIRIHGVIALGSIAYRDRCMVRAINGKPLERPFIYPKEQTVEAKEQGHAA